MPPSDRHAGAEVADLGNGEGDVLAAGSVDGLSQVDQPIAVTMGQRLEQHAADNAEDRRVGTDAERQGDHDDCR